MNICLTETFKTSFPVFLYRSGWDPHIPWRKPTIALFLSLSEANRIQFSHLKALFPSPAETNSTPCFSMWLRGCELPVLHFILHNQRRTFGYFKRLLQEYNCTTPWLYHCHSRPRNGMFHVASSQIYMSMSTPMVLFIRVALVLRWNDKLQTEHISRCTSWVSEKVTIMYVNVANLLSLLSRTAQNLQKPFGKVTTSAKATLPYTWMYMNYTYHAARPTCF